VVDLFEWSDELSMQGIGGHVRSIFGGHHPHQCIGERSTRRRVLSADSG
jgi:hypothetical protein